MKESISSIIKYCNSIYVGEKCCFAKDGICREEKGCFLYKPSCLPAFWEVKQKQSRWSSEDSSMAKLLLQSGYKTVFRTELTGTVYAKKDSEHVWEMDKSLFCNIAEGESVQLVDITDDNDWMVNYR